MMEKTLQNLRQKIQQTLRPTCLSDEQCQIETRLVLQAIMGLSIEDCYKTDDFILTATQEVRLDEILVERTKRRRPIQYILGEAHFYGLTLKVTPDVLIPRPETELLVELSLNAIEKNGYTRILDIGTGSGAIALALAKHTPGSVKITATDLSQAALAVTTENARQLGLRDRINFVHSDLFEALKNQGFDLIVSNPPYIDPALKPTLQPEVADHEPELALFAENNGLEVYEKIVADSVHYLTAGGTLALELGEGQRQPVKTLYNEYGYRQITSIDDYAGIPRIISGHRG